jgi:hypothetical protein
MIFSKFVSQEKQSKGQQKQEIHAKVKKNIHFIWMCTRSGRKSLNTPLLAVQQ